MTTSYTIGDDISEAEPDELYRRFVVELLTDAAESASNVGSGGPPSIDWDAIWRSGSEAASKEQAIGRIVLTAARVAWRFEGDPQTLTEPTPSMREGVDALPAAPAPAEPTVGPRPQSWPVPSPGIFEAPPWPLVAVETPPESSIDVVAPPEPPVVVETPPESSIDVVAPPEPPVVVGAALSPAVAVETPSEAGVATEALLEAEGAAEIAPGREMQRLARRKKWATVFGWVRNIGLLVILFAAWQVWGTNISQHRAQESLRQQFRSHVHGTGVTRLSLVSADARLPEPAEGSVVGHLQIPAIGVDQYVVEGTAEADLARGPGHYLGTAMPGQQGNVAIAGHRTTYGAPFNQLDRLTVADKITLTTDSGEAYVYAVTQSPVAVSPRDVGVLNPFGDNRLTLTTCNPKFSASQRLIVVASLRTVVAGSPGASSSQSSHLRAHRAIRIGSVGWNMRYLPGVLLASALLVLFGLLYREVTLHFGRRGRWLILTPIWLAGLYFLFGLLTQFLPATL